MGPLATLNLGSVCLCGLIDPGTGFGTDVDRETIDVTGWQGSASGASPTVYTGYPRIIRPARRNCEPTITPANALRHY